MEQLHRTTVISPTLQKSITRNYTVYTVLTPYFSSENGVTDFSVNRRYKDFEWLHESLSLHCPGVLIPPLPEKVFFGRFDEEFIQSRIRGLETFLNRVQRHSILNQHQFVKSFFQECQMDICYQHLKEFQENNTLPKKGLGEWFESKLDELSVKEQEIQTSSFRLTETTESKIQPIRESIGDALDRLSRATKSTCILMSTYDTSGKLLAAHCGACGQLNTCEDSHQSGPFSENTTISSHPYPLNQYIQTEMNLSTARSQSVHSMRMELEEPMIRLFKTLKELNRNLKIQSESHREYLVKATILQKKIKENPSENSYESLTENGTNGTQTETRTESETETETETGEGRTVSQNGTENKGIKKQKDLTPLREEVERYRTIYEQTSTNLLLDHDRYQLEKRNDLMNAMRSLATIQIDYCQHATGELLLLHSSIEQAIVTSLIDSASSSFLPSAPLMGIVTSGSSHYDPVVRTLSGHSVGHVAVAVPISEQSFSHSHSQRPLSHSHSKVIDLSGTNSADILKDDFDNEEEIIVGI